MRVAVIGVGYVGLVVGTCLAESGNDVVCVDIDGERISLLDEGRSPIHEVGLEELIRRNRAHARLRFTTSLDTAVRESDVIFIAVGTPSQADGMADLTAVETAARGIGQASNGFKIVVTKSTVPPGTTRRLKELISALTPHPIAVVSNPEFLKEGKAVDDFMRPDRVVLGVENDDGVAATMRELYAPFVRTGNPIILMDLESAEMTKYAANVFLATKISFMNEMAVLCEEVGADVENVRRGMGADRRIGSSFLFAGVGYGGACLPKDVAALIRIAEAHGCQLQVAQAVGAVNERQREWFFERILRHFHGDLNGRLIAVWGLTFKPGTDDMRDAPSIDIVTNLLRSGAQVAVHDPMMGETVKTLFGGRVVQHAEPYRALEAADGLAVLTEWPEFRNPNFQRMKRLMATAVVFDGRNVYNPQRLRNLGFTYYGVGRR
jgi:UDPglucose 6-dehydrogenase